jgi:glutaredoxin
LIELTLYGRPGCHLCDEMRAGLLALQSDLGYGLAEIDVDGDPELARRYGHLVPVLMLGDVEVCHFFLDPEALRAHLARLRA